MQFLILFAIYNDVTTGSGAVLQPPHEPCKSPLPWTLEQFGAAKAMCRRCCLVQWMVAHCHCSPKWLWHTGDLGPCAAQGHDHRMPPSPATGGCLQTSKALKCHFWFPPPKKQEMCFKGPLKTFRGKNRKQCFKALGRPFECLEGSCGNPGAF